MIHSRRMPLRIALRMGVVIVLFAGLWAAFIYSLYAYVGLKFLRVPFLPIATIGTAVAFYVGFKNNAAYERFWEGRKIWGGIVNASRSWGTAVMSYIEVGDTSHGAHELRRELIYRQLAWANALRLQLRRTSRFFHKPAAPTKRRLEKHAEVMRNDWDKELSGFLDADELAQVSQRKNSATHLLTTQGTQLARLVASKKLDLFHQIAMMELITEFYALQGKCERIKNTPFPRQYAEYSRMFTRIFVLLVPFGMLDVFTDQIEQAPDFVSSLLLVIPMILASGLVTWVFVVMEGIGDATEDPFERSLSDVPMNALCRTIEIDLREMLGETDLPPKEEPIDRVLY